MQEAKLWLEGRSGGHSRGGTNRSVSRRTQGWGPGTLQVALAALVPAATPPPALIGRRPATSRERHSAPGAQANANGPPRE